MTPLVCTLFVERKDREIASRIWRFSVARLSFWGGGGGRTLSLVPVSLLFWISLLFAPFAIFLSFLFGQSKPKILRNRKQKRLQKARKIAKKRRRRARKSKKQGHGNQVGQCPSTVRPVFPVVVFQLSKQQNRTRTTPSTVLGQRDSP